MHVFLLWFPWLPKCVASRIQVHYGTILFYFIWSRGKCESFIFCIKSVIAMKEFHFKDFIGEGVASRIRQDNVYQNSYIYIYQM